jgi:hypothetical protein
MSQEDITVVAVVLLYENKPSAMKTDIRVKGHTGMVTCKVLVNVDLKKRAAEIEVTCD